jgi:hypothetical protein
MMLSAASGFDIRFIRRQIAKYGLDPVAQGSHAIKWGGVTLTIETYGWGRVFHAGDKGHDLSLTWLEVGEKAPTLPGWARVVRAFVDRPECLGHRAADHVCDGGKNPDTSEEERACAWRDRCIVAQRIAGKPENVASVLEQFTDDDLARKVEEGKPKRKKSDPEAARARKKKSAATYEDSVAMVIGFVDRVMELGGWTLQTNRFRASAGQFFLRPYERTGRNNYMTLFVRERDPAQNQIPGAGRMPSIVMLYPHSSDRRFSMQIRSAQVDWIRSVMPNHLQVRLGTYDQTHGKIVSVNRITMEDFEEVAQGLFQVIQERRFDSQGSFPAIGTTAPRIWHQWSIFGGKR